MHNRAPSCVPVRQMLPHGEVGSENVNWGCRMTNWRNGWTTAPELNLLFCSALLCRRGIVALKGIAALLIDICLYTFGGWTGATCQLRHTNSGRTQPTQRRWRRGKRRRHLPVHMKQSGPLRGALTPSGTHAPTAQQRLLAPGTAHAARTRTPCTIKEGLGHCPASGTPELD